jgi:hypothetical protein
MSELDPDRPAPGLDDDTDEGSEDKFGPEDDDGNDGKFGTEEDEGSDNKFGPDADEDDGMEQFAPES